MLWFDTYVQSCLYAEASVACQFVFPCQRPRVSVDFLDDLCYAHVAEIEFHLLAVLYATMLAFAPDARFE